MIDPVLNTGGSLEAKRFFYNETVLIEALHVKEVWQHISLYSQQQVAAAKDG